MKRLRVLIADDEPLAREAVASVLAGNPEVEIAAQCGDGRSALAAIRAQRPDVVFLDVQMPELGGVEVMAQLPPGPPPAVVFVTAFDEHAVRAFELCAVDYLLKPFRPARLQGALERARDRLRESDAAQVQRRTEELLEQLRRLQAPAERAERRVVFKIAGEHVFLDPAEIAWIEAQGDLVRVRAGAGLHHVRETLQSVEQRLAGGPFVRIHRSFIVHPAHVRRITPTLYGDCDVLMSDGAKLRLSRSYRDRLSALLGGPAS